MSRQSLWRVTDADRHGYSHSHGVGDTDSDTYTDSNPSSDSHGYCNDTSSYSDAHRAGYSDGKASSDPAATALARKVDSKELIALKAQ